MELSILRWLQQFSSDSLDTLFIGITQLGEENVLIVFITLIYWNIDKKFGKLLGFATMMTLVVNNSLKEIFSFARPIGEEGIRSLRTETATGKAFPSGHTQTATTFYTMISMYAGKKWIQIICSSVIFLIGMSRMYLGLHYPKDVIAAWLLGIFIATFVYYNMKTNKHPLYIYLGAAGLGLILLPISQSEDYFKALGLLLGFVLACIIEERYVKFKIDVSIVKKGIRLVLGLIILVVIKSGLKIIFPDALIFDLIRYFFVSFIAIGIYPMLFKKYDF